MKIVEENNLKTYAHIVNGKVVNVSVWDGVAAYNPIEEIIEIPEGVIAGIDWDYKEGKFIDKRPKPTATE